MQNQKSNQWKLQQVRPRWIQKKMALLSCLPNCCNMVLPHVETSWYIWIEYSCSPIIWVQIVGETFRDCQFWFCVLLNDWFEHLPGQGCFSWWSSFFSVFSLSFLRVSVNGRNITYVLLHGCCFLYDTALLGTYCTHAPVRYALLRWDSSNVCLDGHMCAIPWLTYFSRYVWTSSWTASRCHKSAAELTTINASIALEASISLLLTLENTFLYLFLFSQWKVSFAGSMEDTWLCQLSGQTLWFHISPSLYCGHHIVSNQSI